MHLKCIIALRPEISDIWHFSIDRGDQLDFFVYSKRAKYVYVLYMDVTAAQGIQLPARACAGADRKRINSFPVMIPASIKIWSRLIRLRNQGGINKMEAQEPVLF